MPAPMPLDDAVTRRAFVAGVAAAGLISCNGEPRIGPGTGGRLSADRGAPGRTH
jgi:hypothetical protein